MSFRGWRGQKVNNIRCTRLWIALENLFRRSRLDGTPITEAWPLCPACAGYHQPSYVSCDGLRRGPGPSRSLVDWAYDQEEARLDGAASDG